MTSLALIMIAAALVLTGAQENGRDVLAIQVALARAGFSPGVIDDRLGPQSASRWMRTAALAEADPEPVAEPLVPRKINLLAHHTLLAAALTRAKLATADHVQAALPEIA